MRHFKKILALIILISLTAAPVLADELGENIIISTLMDMFDLDPQSFEIEVLSNQLAGKTITGSALKLKPLTQKDPLGLFTVLATISEEGKAVATGQVRMRIHKYATVVVSGDRIKRSEVMDPDRLTLQRMEVTNLLEKPLTTLEEMTGLRAKRNLKKGCIVTTGAVEAIPAIERGDETVIVFDDGVCRITAPGTAMQAGSKGDIIKVKNKATRKVITARVIDDGVVAVDP